MMFSPSKTQGEVIEALADTKGPKRVLLTGGRRSGKTEVVYHASILLNLAHGRGVLIVPDQKAIERVEKDYPGIRNFVDIKHPHSHKLFDVEPAFIVIDDLVAFSCKPMMLEIFVSDNFEGRVLIATETDILGEGLHLLVSAHLRGDFARFMMPSWERSEAAKDIYESSVGTVGLGAANGIWGGR